MSAAYWYRNVDDLVYLVYRVLAIDLLGWGRFARAHFRGHTSNETATWLGEPIRTALHQLICHQYRHHQETKIPISNIIKPS